MDILYLFQHSEAQDRELLYSLRSVARGAPWIGKVWIFGDRPAFLSGDRSLIEHVPHEYIAGVGPFRVPVRNGFLLTYLGSLIPELSHDFLLFCDDFVLLDDSTEAELCKNRVYQDLARVTERGRGKWKDALWRTYDLLVRLGYPGYNFETHVPQRFTKTWVLEAFATFRDFITEDRLYGPLAATAILNHAHKQHDLPLTFLLEEHRKLGIFDVVPYEHLETICAGKLFLNFDEKGFSPALDRYLGERFSEPCKYER